jgi:uncharacterized RDD family membrane protein YckC
VATSLAAARRGRAARQAREVMTDLNGDASKTRFFAAWIDNTIAFIVCIAIGARLPGPFSSPVRWSIAALAFMGYFFVQEGAWGTTLGKRIFALHVVRVDGSTAGWWEALSRSTLRLVEVNPVLLGALPAALAVAWSRRKQRLGDMLAGTVVIRQSGPQVARD